MTLFDLDSQYREKATIFRVFSLLPSAVRCSPAVSVGGLRQHRWTSARAANTKEIWTLSLA